MWHFIATPHTMKLSFLKFAFGLILLTSCGDQPKQLSGKRETIEVAYVNWACDCADFIEIKYFKDNPEYEIKEEDCIFIEPADLTIQIPEEYYNSGHFERYLKLTGQFYKDKGIPNSYERKTPEQPRKARVFRYDSFTFLDKASHDTNSKVTSGLLNGTWIHEEDGLSSLTISNNQWTFNYENNSSKEDDIYQISIVDKLPEFVKETEKAEFIILTNKTDTMYFEILNLDAKVLSLLNYPTGRRHLYTKK